MRRATDCSDQFQAFRGATADHSLKPELGNLDRSPMSPFFFWILPLLMLVFGAAVIINRNPVASALSLVVSFLGLAALFMSLDAFFIGIIQVLVYAGAVMVLFLFIIMLLDLRAEERRRINFVAFAGGAAVAVIFFGQLYLVIGHLRRGEAAFPACSPRQRATMCIASACSFSATTICRFKSSACSSWSRRSA